MRALLRPLHLLILATSTAALTFTGLAPVASAAGSVSGNQSADVNFTTPSGNIDCLLYQSSGEVVADCLVEKATWKNAPSQPSDCGLDWAPNEVYVGSVRKGTTITNTVGVGACRGDIGPLCVAESCKTLAYGKSVSLGRITCSSATSGVTCLTTSGKRKGFTINRASYTLIK